MLAAITLTLVAGVLGWMLAMRAMHPVTARTEEVIILQDETIAILKETIVILKKTRDLETARADAAEMLK